MKKILIFNLFIVAFIVKAQIAIGTTTPNAQALLEVSSSDKGLLMSHVELEATNSFSPLSAHTAGMMVYNTATNGTYPNNVFPGLYYNDGFTWVRVEGFGTNIGEIKNSVETTDHNGWYLLNGRLVSSLPTVASTNAATLGLGSNLPNSSNRILKGKSGAETFAQLGGNTSFTILRTNLPDITYTGNTGSAGAHTHSYTDRGSSVWHGSTGSGVVGLTNVNGSNRTTGDAGNHSHTVTVASGGSGTAVNLTPNFLVVQTFIYLGR